MNKEEMQRENASLKRKISRLEKANKKPMAGQKGLDDLQAKFTAITSSSNDAIIMMDDDGITNFWNMAAERIFGYKAEEMLGKLLSDFIIPPQYVDRHVAGVARFKETSSAGKIFGRTLELSALRKNGEEFPMEISYYVSPIRLNGRWHAVAIIRDITGRKEAEKSLTLYAKRMENALFRANDVLRFIATPPEIVPVFTISPAYRSVRSVGGGDIVKWVRFQSQYAGLYLHDVAGHDIEEILLNILAASLADICKTNPAKKSPSTPSAFLHQMNERLTKYCGERPDYLTAIYLLMDFEEREIKMAAGGHPRPWLIKPDGTVRQVEMEAGFILGQFAIDPITDDRYRDIVHKPETGQLLLVYSDGLMEQVDAGGTVFEEKFRKEIGPMLAGLVPRAAYEIIRREFETHLGGRAPDDDVSFVFIGTRPADKYETVRFVPGPALFALIRSHKSGRDNDPAAFPKQSAAKNTCEPAGKSDGFIIHKLSDLYDPITQMLKNARWADKRINQVELAVSEMVVNAIMHGGMCDNCPVELSYILHDDELEICVTDEGPGFDSKTLPQSIEGNLLMGGGRGHHIIRALTDGLYFNDAGNRCWVLFQKHRPGDMQPLAAFGKNIMAAGSAG